MGTLVGMVGWPERSLHTSLLFAMLQSSPFTAVLKHSPSSVVSYVGLDNQDTLLSVVSYYSIFLQDLTNLCIIPINRVRVNSIYKGGKSVANYLFALNTMDFQQCRQTDLWIKHNSYRYCEVNKSLSKLKNNN